MDCWHDGNTSWSSEQDRNSWTNSLSIIKNTKPDSQPRSRKRCADVQFSRKESNFKSITRWLQRKRSPSAKNRQRWILEHDACSQLRSQSGSIKDIWTHKDREEEVWTKSTESTPKTTESGAVTLESGALTQESRKKTSEARAIISWALKIHWTTKLASFE